MPLDSPLAVPDPPPFPLSQSLAAARALAAEGRWFAAHDVLEEAWKADRSGPWQGLAQLCVGMTHLQRGNRVGAARLLRRGAGTLASYDRPYGPGAALDLPTLIGRALALATAVDKGAEPTDLAGALGW